jgi:hypothetical protein
MEAMGLPRTREAGRFLSGWAVFGFLVVCLLFSGATLSGCKGKKKKNLANDGISGGLLVFSDDFDRSEIGSNWQARSGKWRIDKGKLVCKGDRNEGIWLNFKLPQRVRVEFDAMALEDEGDIKFEVFATEQRHQTGYILIFGGWQNSVTVIARLNEHGEDRMESPMRVEKGKTYHIAVVRTDGSLRWFIDGKLVLSYDDETPLRGDYFGFNNWNSLVTFDNLKVFQL